MDKSHFRLFSLNIFFKEGNDIKIMPIKKIYQIKMIFKHLLKIYYLSKDIILINLGH